MHLSTSLGFSVTSFLDKVPLVTVKRGDHDRNRLARTLP